MTRIRQFLRRFAEDASGVVAIEAVLMLPILLWAYLGLFSFFDMMRQQSVNQKAAFVISDMLSRETDYVNDPYITNAFELFRRMTRATSDSAMRISVLKYNGTQKVFQVDWSKARGPKTALKDGDVVGWQSRLPVILDNERVILVETTSQYEIPFNAVNMDDFAINQFVFVRPRFAPQLCFSNDPNANKCVN